MVTIEGKIHLDAETISRLLQVGAILGGKEERDENNPVLIEIIYSNKRTDFIAPSVYGGLCVEFGYEL